MAQPKSNRRTAGNLREWKGNASVTTGRPGGIATDVNDERLLRPEDVANLLTVSKTTVYRLARSGELASVKVRGMFRFRRQAVADFLAAAERPVEPKRRSPLRGRPRKQWVPFDAA
jgi:excisionase family DNA binding protein